MRALARSILRAKGALSNCIAPMGAPSGSNRETAGGLPTLPPGGRSGKAEPEVMTRLATRLRVAGCAWVACGATFSLDMQCHVVELVEVPPSSGFVQKYSREVKKDVRGISRSALPALQE